MPPISASVRLVGMASRVRTATTAMAAHSPITKAVRPSPASKPTSRFENVSATCTPNHSGASTTPAVKTTIAPIGRRLGNRRPIVKIAPPSFAPVAMAKMMATMRRPEGPVTRFRARLLPFVVARAVRAGGTVAKSTHLYLLPHRCAYWLACRNTARPCAQQEVEHECVAELRAECTLRESYGLDTFPPRG